MSLYYESPLNPHSENHSSSKISQGLWDAFVHVVLDITVQGYEAMRKNIRPSLGWEENHFTMNLADFMRTIAQDHSFLFVIDICLEVPIYTEEMKLGLDTYKEAKLIDLQLRDPSSANYDKVYFAWEAKRISDRQLDSENGYLVGEYVGEGIFRFIDAKYSSEVNDAGMLGYILVGEAAHIVPCINQSMQDPKRKRRLTDKDYLKHADPIGTFTDVYESTHARAKGKPDIRLTHLFFTFDFV